MKQLITFKYPESDAIGIIKEQILNVLPEQVLENADIEVLIEREENETVDLGIIIALEEEFKILFPQISARPIYQSDTGQYYYYFEKESLSGVTYKCVATFIGGVGISKAAILSDRLIQNFNPAVVVNIGIAGALSSDVKLLDVIVGKQAEDYLYSSKAIKQEEGFEFELSGDPYKCTDTYWQHSQNLPFAHKEDHDSFQKKCNDLAKDVLGPEKLNELQENKFVNGLPIIASGNIASGSIVGSTEHFSKWLKKQSDRKYLALEMESAGLMLAAHSRRVDSIIIRGISDFSDDRKQEFDAIEDGSLRKIAMENCVSLLWLLLSLDKLKS
jgi:nucleoside phosphorylase